MDTEIIEEKARRQMCVLLSLETLFICIVFCKWDISLPHSDLIALKSAVVFRLIFCGTPILITAASLYSRRVYKACEMLHCIAAGLPSLAFFAYGAVPLGLFTILALCHRYIIYKYLIVREMKKYDRY